MRCHAFILLLPALAVLNYTMLHGNSISATKSHPMIWMAVDAALALFCLSIAVAAPLLDSQVVLPRSLYPAPLVSLRRWFAAEFDHYLVADPPPFFQGLVWLALVFLWPVCVANLYGVITRRRRWVATTSIMAGVHMLTTTSAITGEIMQGSGRATPKLVGFYAPFALLAVTLVLRGLSLCAGLPADTYVLPPPSPMIWKAVDAASAVFSLSIAATAPLVESQLVLPRDLYPAPLVGVRRWFEAEFDHYLLVNPPPFLRGLVWLILAFLWPVCVANLYGVVTRRRRWVATATLVTGVNMLTYSSAVFGEMLGSGRATPKLLQFYAPFALLAVTLVVRGLWMCAQLPADTTARLVDSSAQKKRA